MYTAPWDYFDKSSELPEPDESCPRTRRGIAFIKHKSRYIDQLPSPQTMGRLFVAMVAEAAGDFEAAAELQVTPHEQQLIDDVNDHEPIAANTELARQCAQVIGRGLCPLYCYNPNAIAVEPRQLDSQSSLA